MIMLVQAVLALLAFWLVFALLRIAREAHGAPHAAVAPRPTPQTTIARLPAVDA